MSSSIRLTQTVQKGGCAAKIPALELRKILSQVHFKNQDPNLLVDSGLFDDAAVYKLTEELAIVQTLDFFTPILDTAYVFGRVAATNALSDVYAMGGEPKTAMGILAYPHSSMDSSIVAEVIQGACSAIEESGANMVGGHSIDDDTLKYGLSVTGVIHPNRIWSNSGAKVGDVLILTKPLGTGALTAALKRSEVSEADIDGAIKSMCQLNRCKDLLSESQEIEIHSATDITGFGLLGHAYQMAGASQVTLEINYKNIPQFSLAMELIKKGFLTKAHRTNLEYVRKATDFGDLPEEAQKILADPQTSGGLLLSVGKNSATAILNQLKKRFVFAEIIGQVMAESENKIKIL